jgi:hypothetical protein
MNNVEPLGGWFDDLSDSVSNFFNPVVELAPTTGAVDWGSTLGETSGTYGGYYGYNPSFFNSGSGSSSVTTTATTNAGGDLFSGFNEFLTGATSTLGNLFNTGVSAYATVQQLINAQNPTDQIIYDPRLGGAVVQRTQNGVVTYVPVATAYPQLVGQVATADKSRNMSTILIVGALGLGLILILKKK